MNKPISLSVETSGRLGSVALACGPDIIIETPFSAPLRHSAELFEASARLVSAASLLPTSIEQVYVSVGPGSFTGIRIAITLAKTMAFAANVRIVAVETLFALAHNALDYAADSGTTVSRIASILDAKRGQFFIAIYDVNKNGTIATVVPDVLLTVPEFLAQYTDRPIHILGEGLLYYHSLFSLPNIHIIPESANPKSKIENPKSYWSPHASTIHRIGYAKALAGDFADPFTLTPHYLRGPDAVIKRQIA